MNAVSRSQACRLGYKEGKGVVAGTDVLKEQGGEEENARKLCSFSFLLHPPLLWQSEVPRRLGESLIATPSFYALAARMRSESIKEPDRGRGRAETLHGL